MTGHISQHIRHEGAWRHSDSTPFNLNVWRCYTADVVLPKQPKFHTRTLLPADDVQFCSSRRCAEYRNFKLLTNLLHDTTYVHRQDLDSPPIK